MEITNDTLNALQSYFNVLKHTGYKPYSEVFKLLVLVFLEELLTEDMAELVTEEDYNKIVKAIYCISGSCMIPYPDYLKSISEPVKRVFDEYRITETNIMRSIESDFRVLS